MTFSTLSTPEEFEAAMTALPAWLRPQVAEMAATDRRKTGGGDHAHSDAREFAVRHLLLRGATLKSESWTLSATPEQREADKATRREAEERCRRIVREWGSL